MGMAADRFDARRGMVLDEANAIGTAFQRAAYLPEPEGQAVQELLRVYLPLRVATDDTAQVQANIQRSIEVQAELRAITANVAQGRPDRLLWQSSTRCQLLSRGSRGPVTRVRRRS
jgi:hypothetical protein